MRARTHTHTHGPSQRPQSDAYSSVSAKTHKKQSTHSNALCAAFMTPYAGSDRVVISPSASTEPRITLRIVRRQTNPPNISQSNYSPAVINMQPQTFPNSAHEAVRESCNLPGTAGQTLCRQVASLLARIIVTHVCACARACARASTCELRQPPVWPFVSGDSPIRRRAPCALRPGVPAGAWALTTTRTTTSHSPGWPCIAGGPGGRGFGGRGFDGDDVY